MLHVYVCGIIALHGISAAKNVDESPNIVGGIRADDRQYPYQASLRYKNRHFCGGSVLNKRWILTAAHCLTSFKDATIEVVLGSNILNKGGEEYHSVQVIGHPKYDSELIRNDVGLIKVERNITFSNKVRPIDLPTEDFTKSNYPAVLSGWGLTSYPGSTPNELHHIQLNVIDQKRCLKTSFRVTKDNICTLNKRGEGVCRGDSGGPLVADGEQIGIVSWGSPCARGRPDVFTRVYSYLDWINKYIQEESG